MWVYGLVDVDVLLFRYFLCQLLLLNCFGDYRFSNIAVSDTKEKLHFDSKGHCAQWTCFPRVSSCLDCLETFDDGATVKLFSQCLSLLKMQMLVINPTFAHLFGCGEVGWLHLALLNPSITQGSWINGMQRKAVSARWHAGRIPAAGTRQAHPSRNRSKCLSHILNAWWHVSFCRVLLFRIKKTHRGTQII